MYFVCWILLLPLIKFGQVTKLSISKLCLSKLLQENHRNSLQEVKLTEGNLFPGHHWLLKFSQHEPNGPIILSPRKDQELSVPPHEACNYSPVCGQKTRERKSSERNKTKGTEQTRRRYGPTELPGVCQLLAAGFTSFQNSSWIPAFEFCETSWSV